MPKRERFKTKYPGVVYVMVGKEKVYYIYYRRKGETKQIEEKAAITGKTMTPALANQLRAERIKGKVPTNKEKRQEQRNVEEALKAAREAEAGKMTISRLWDLYRENLEGLKSQAADTSRFTNYLKPTFGDKEPQEIIPLDVDRLRRKTLAGKSGQTVKHVLALLRRIVRYGVKKRVAQGFTFDLDMPSVDNQVTETLNNDELKRLLKALDESDDIQVSHLMKLALFTGMRKGELLKLKWSDLDYDSGLILIRSPKGKKSVYIPMNQQARATLEGHPRIGEHVFVNSKGKPFKEIRKRVDAIKTAAGLPKGFRPLHGLRHVYASLLASSGQVDIYTLQRLLTHKSTTTTQRYAHIMDQALKRASGVIVDMLAEARDKD